jgi:hypothetical protein
LLSPAIVAAGYAAISSRREESQLSCFWKS